MDTETNITLKDSQLMRRLTREGKSIANIVKEDFPHLTYHEVYMEVYSEGGKSSQGIKTMISKRLNKLVEAEESERRKLVKEIQDLVWHLYNKHKENHRKLANIRKALKGSI